jgi:hypothetical protein
MSAKQTIQQAQGGGSRLPGQVPPGSHPHPNRHRKALKSAFVVAGVGLFTWLVGLIFLILGTPQGILVSLMVIGVTLLLLSPVWYFTYMEKLEPELYAPDSPQHGSTKKYDEEGERR